MWRATIFLLLWSHPAIADDYILLRFGATWCGPCHTQQEIHKTAGIPALLKKYKIKDNFIDVDQYPAMANMWQVTSIPTTILVKRQTKNTAVPVRRASGEVLTAVKYKEFVIPP